MLSVLRQAADIVKSGKETRGVVMFRILISPLIAWAVIGICEQKPAAAQDAQHEASAVVARQHGEAQEAAVATPTVVPPTPAAPVPSPAPNAMKRRAGELNGSDANDRANVLGMYLQEGVKGQVRIVDVAAASPAYEADIKRGDALVQLDKFKADNYRKWIDGIRDIVTKAPDGSQLPIILVRNGRTLTTQIRVPISSTGRLQLPVGPGGMPPQGGQMPPSGAQPDVVGMPVPGTAGGPGAAAGSDVAIQNGPFNNFFGSQSPTAERAMAELVRIGLVRIGPKQTGATNPPSSPGYPADAAQGATGSPPTDSKARIGMAGFRNESNGMMVMVDIGTLEPGNYRVAISDAAALSGAPQPGPSPPPNPPVTDPGVSPNAQPTGASGIPPANVPPVTQSNQQSAATNSPAQVDAVPPLGTPPNGNSITLPAQPVIPPVSTPNRPPNPSFGDLGTLTVDQSGTGRMQKISEGLQIQSIIGQALVIYPQTDTPSVTLPPDLNPTIDPAAKSISQQASSAGSATAQNKGSIAGAATSNSAKPVAGGIIRLLSDRNPPSSPGNTQSSPNPASPPQPANNSPAVPQGTVR